MKPLDCIVLALIALWVAFSIRSMWKRKKSGKCIGCSGDCGSCPSAQQRPQNPDNH